MFDGMKAIRNLLLGAILGALIGWFLGFLRLPYIEKISSFLLGFIACVILFLLVLALLLAWKKHASLLRLVGEEPVQQDSKKTATRSYLIIWILVVAFIIAGGLLSSILIQRQSKFIKSQLQKQNNKIQQQSELMGSVMKSNMVFLLNDIL